MFPTKQRQTLAHLLLGLLWSVDRPASASSGSRSRSPAAVDATAFRSSMRSPTDYPRYCIPVAV